MQALIPSELVAAKELLADCPAVDMHCDTLEHALDGEDLFDCPRAQAGPEQLIAGGVGIAVYAIWVPAYLGNDRAWERVNAMMTHLRSLSRDDDPRVTVAPCPRPHARGVTLYPALEDARVLLGGERRVEKLSEWSARYVTLTWNTGNRYATSWEDSRSESVGLTTEGESLVCALDDAGIRVDVSHLSDRAAREAIARASIPPIASHSASRALRPHPRNISDELAVSVADRGGVVGVNLHRPFLSVAGRDASIGDAVCHIEHLWNVAGGDGVAIGSDFDGIPIGPKGLETAARIPHLVAALFRRGHKADLLRRLVRMNALRGLGLTTEGDAE